MILVLDNEVNPEYRYLGPEIARFVPDSQYMVYASDPEPPTLSECSGIILSGSTASVYDETYSDLVTPQLDLVERCIDEQIPLLGVCFGHQLINLGLGGSVEADRRRATFVEMTSVEEGAILDGVRPIVPVLHTDLVTEPGRNMERTASTAYNEFFCTRHTDAPIWTVQFHPEFTPRVEDRPSDWTRGGHSFDGSTATDVFENFTRICRR